MLYGRLSMWFNVRAMRRICLLSLTCAVLAAAASCGWVDRQTKMRIRGTVLESQSGEPIPDVYVDIADNQELLRLTLHPKTMAGEAGTFDVVYIHDYDRNRIFWFVPVGGEPEVPESLIIEFTKDGYAPAILNFDPRQLERDSHRAYMVGEVKLHKE